MHSLGADKNQYGSPAATVVLSSLFGGFSRSLANAPQWSTRRRASAELFCFTEAGAVENGVAVRSPTGPTCRRSRKPKHASRTLCPAHSVSCRGRSGRAGRTRILRIATVRPRDRHRHTVRIEPICTVLRIARSGYRRQAEQLRDPSRRGAQVKRDDEIPQPEIRRVWRIWRVCQADTHIYGVQKDWRQMSRKALRSGAARSGG